MGIQRADTYEQIRSCYKVMRQLRPHLVEEKAFVEQVQRQLAEGYQLVYSQDGDDDKSSCRIQISRILGLGQSTLYR